MDIFDKIQTLPPDVALFVASLFVVCFTLVFGAFLVHVAVKHGKVVERKVRNTNGQMNFLSEDK